MRCFLLVLLMAMGWNGYGLSVRVMSYNLRYNTPNDGVNAWPNRLDKVVDLITRYDPDIIGVQEALQGQLQDLVSRLDKYEYIGVGRDDGKTKGEYSAILYKKEKFQIVKESTFWLSETPETPGSKNWDAAITRVATWAIMKTQTGESFFVLNTHFDHIGKEARKNSASLIGKKIPELSAGLPVILTGDLNCVREEPPYQILTSQAFRFIDPAPKNPPGTYCTFSVKEECTAIDYILHTQEWTADSYRVISDNDGTWYPSDHLPVVVELKM